MTVRIIDCPTCWGTRRLFIALYPTTYYGRSFVVRCWACNGSGQQAVRD